MGAQRCFNLGQQGRRLRPIHLIQMFERLPVRPPDIVGLDLPASAAFAYFCVSHIT